jgi:hypothetical protein
MTEIRKNFKKRLINVKSIDHVNVKLNSIYEVTEHQDGYHYYIIDDSGNVIKLARNRFEDPGLEFTTGPGVKKDNHYDNSNGSLYLFAEQHQLNAWEFEIIKRIVRCRKKGEFISDIEKTKRVLDIYLKEQGHLFENQIEKLNK